MKRKVIIKKIQGRSGFMRKEIPLFFSNALQRHIESNLHLYETLSQKAHGLRHAAVALTIVEVDETSTDEFISSCKVDRRDAALILTRRSFSLKNHAGQWALPGGRIDRGESPEDTALRELSEEVGLNLDRKDILGRLDDFATRSGFVMTPVVLWGGPGARLTPNPAEVSSLHRISLREFLRPDAPLLEEYSESLHPVLYMPVGSGWIAAPTAALLYQFREMALLGKETRVAHYEQPYFAWS